MWQLMNTLLEAAGEEHAATNLILTNPDVLADYVNEFFGPEGPHPTETPDETAVREQAEARAQFEAEIRPKSRMLFLASSSGPRWICRPLAVKPMSPAILGQLQRDDGLLS